MTVLAVALGGAFGAVARYLTTVWVRDFAGGAMPWGTATVNVVGCFLLGFALVWLQASLSSDQARAFVAIGVLGSFTTFSTFGEETLAMLQGGAWWRAGSYVAGSVVLGVIAVAVGAALALAVVPGQRS